MRSTGSNYAEEKFNQELAKALIKSFTENPFENEEEVIIAGMKNKENRSAILNYAKSLISNVRLYDDSIGEDNYRRTFMSEKHNRVKTVDDYRIANCVDENRERLLNQLHTYFAKKEIDTSLVDKVPKILQETIIQYCYKKLSASIKHDCGLFREGHPFADSIPKTMWAEEAILMPELISNNATNDCIKYCDTLRKAGIKSNSWGYVHEATVYEGRLSYCDKKKDVIMKCRLTQHSASSLKELVYYCYNVALLKLGQYSVSEFILGAAELEEDPLNWVD